MNEFTAFDSDRNWVGFPVPRAVLSTSLYQVQKQKRSVSGLCFFR